MRYEYHNFSENFKAIKKTKDMAITRELMLSEVAKVIDGRPALVRKSLIKCGVSLSPRAGKVEIVTAVANSLIQKCVRVSLMNLISANQLPFIDGTSKILNTKERVNDLDTDISRDGFMNQAGTVATGAKIGGSDILGAGTQILGTIAGIWQGNKGYKAAGEQRAHELKLAEMNKDLMLQQMNLQANVSVAPPTQAGLGGSSKVTFILLGVGVLAVIGYFIISNRKGASSSAPVAAPVVTN